MPHLGIDNDVKEIKIAQITFAYRNAEVMNWLTKRGTFLKTEKWAKANELNNTILDNIKNKEGLLDKLQTPCSVFATFESEEGYGRACKWDELPQEKFCGQVLELQEASEPSDIIWENRHFTPFKRTIKRLIVYTVILSLLAGSAAIIYSFTMKSLSAKLKYPKVKCGPTDPIPEEYATRGETAWMNDAIVEYWVNE